MVKCPPAMWETWVRSLGREDPLEKKIKRSLLLGRKAMTNLNSVFKSRDIALPTNVHIDGFELWCWRTLLRDTWTAMRSNKSIIKEINHEYSLEGLMLKL